MEPGACNTSLVSKRIFSIVLKTRTPNYIHTTFSSYVYGVVYAFLRQWKSPFTYLLHCQEIPWCNQELHYCVRKGPPPVPIVSQINPLPAPILLKAVLILSSLICLGLPGGLLPSHFSTKSCMHLSCPPTCYLPRLSHSWFDHWNNSWWGTQIMWLLIMQFPQVCPKHKYFPYTLFSNTFSLCDVALDGG